MKKDYDYFFESIGLTNEEEKNTMISYIETLFKTTIEIINNNKEQYD